MCWKDEKRRKGRGEKRRGGSAKFAVRRAGRKRGIYYGSGLSGLLVVCRRLEAHLVVRLVLGGSEGGDRSNANVVVYSSIGISRAPPRGAASASRGISFSFSLPSFVFILSVSVFPFLSISSSPFLALSDRRGSPSLRRRQGTTTRGSLITKRRGACCREKRNV